MRKLTLVWVMLGIVLVFSLVGTSAASARTEGNREEVVFSAISPENQGTFTMDLETDFGSVLNQSICFRVGNCSKWTGRWFITYLRTSEDHWVTQCELYVPDFIDNEADAMKWRWSEDYIADNCSLENEPQTWEGIYLNTRKEMIPGPCPLACPV